MKLLLIMKLNLLSESPKYIDISVHITHKMKIIKDSEEKRINK